MNLNRKPRHSRGLIVGLSMTEVVLLLVFLLLLGLKFSFSKLESDRKTISELIASKEDHENFEKKAENSLALIGLSLSEIQGYWTRLVALESLEEDNKKHLAELAQIKREKEELLKTVRSLKKRADSLEHLSSEYHSNNGEKGGIDERPCWMYADGKLEYLFSVIMLNDGFVLESQWSDLRSDDPTVLRLPKNILGQRISNTTFEQLCESIYSASLEEKCRHFALVYDRTTAKDAYKRQLATVERYFYKLLKE